MKLAKGTYVKIALIVLLCFLVCDLFGGCMRNSRPLFGDGPGALLAPGGLVGCAGWNAMGEIAGCTGNAVGEMAGYAGDAASEIADATLHSGVRGDVATTSEGSHFEIDGSEIDRVELNWLAGEASVLTVPDSDTGGKILVDEVVDGGTAPVMVCDTSGSTLSIDYMEGGQGLSGCSAGHFGRKHLTVQLPASLADHLKAFELEAASGRYRLENLTCEALELGVASGETNVTGLAAQKIALEVASGQVFVEGSVEGTVDVDQASGAVSLTFGSAAPKRVAGSLASGSLDLAVPADTAFDLAIDKTSGAFNNQFAEPAAADAPVCAIDFDMLSGTFNLMPA